MSDHRELLIKYITHVYRCEGAHFTGEIHEWSLEKNMTPEEITELRSLCKESHHRYPDE